MGQGRPSDVPVWLAVLNKKAGYGYVGAGAAQGSQSTEVLRSEV